MYGLSFVVLVASLLLPRVATGTYDDYAVSLTDQYYIAAQIAAENVTSPQRRRLAALGEYYSVAYASIH